MVDRAREIKAAIDRAGFSRTEQFAEALSEHDCAADPPWAGGNVRDVVGAMGLLPRDGNAMLQRIRQRLGPQAV